MRGLTVKIPIARPVPPHIRADVEGTDETQTPTTAGYTDRIPSEIRDKFKQETMVKLYYARYLHVDSQQLARAIGICRLSVPNEAKYENAVKQLNNIWRRMRNKTFGQESFLSKFVQHVVEQYNFWVVVYNVNRKEFIASEGVDGETPTERDAREEQRDSYRGIKEKLLRDLAGARAAATATATEELNRLLREPHSFSVSRAIAYARRVLSECQKQKDAPSPFRADFGTGKLTVPPEKLTYAHLPTAMKQAIWESEWSYDIGVSMLWSLRDTVDIPATLANSEFLYKAAFTIYGDGMWKFCHGPNADQAYLEYEFKKATGLIGNARVLTEKNRPMVYENLSAAIRQSFDEDEEGLDLLRLPMGSSRTPTKKGNRNSITAISGANSKRTKPM